MFSSAEFHFSLLDYFFFVLVFVVSVAIGIYYSIKAKRHGSNIEDYLLGGRNMQVLPISFSLASTAISGSTMLGQSSEIYAYGVHSWIFLLLGVFRLLMVQFIFLPVFYELQLVSSFTYLERRFDHTVKVFAGVVFILSGFLYVPLTIYVPSLAFQEVTGVNLYVIVVIVMGLCVWYTAIGGIKAVVWTDMFQLILMVASALVILGVGWYNVGGLENVWQAMDRGGRLIFFKLDLDLEARGTLWAYMFSIMFASAYGLGLTQSCIQRYTSVPTIRKAKYCIWIQFFLINALIGIEIIIGAVMYTAYEDCDPYSIGLVRKVDQLLAFFVQERASLFPGFNGIFIAGVVSAGLSSTSSYLNTMSGTIYNDFLAKKFKHASDEKANNIMKLIVVILGAISVLLILIVERMGTVLTITFQSIGIATVTIMGLFILGMLFPQVNSKNVHCRLNPETPDEGIAKKAQTRTKI
uniref:Sodium/solute symporter n=1 Tax=Phlebotomus papatasi TaxID=29031 RepID=A0A1B0GPJ7_PHLPP